MTPELVTYILTVGLGIVVGLVLSAFGRCRYTRWLERKLATARVELADLQRAISWFNPHADGLVSKCAVCGKHPVKFDFIISDELWQKIVPQELSPNVICLNCFDELAGGIPESEWRIIYYTGQAGTVAFIPVAALLKGDKPCAKE